MLTCIPIAAIAIALQLGPGGRVDQLARAARAAAPRELGAAAAREHALAAVLAAPRDLERQELLLGQAWVESRYVPDATSRVVGTHRVTGRLPGTSPGRAHGPFFCGPIQAAAGRSWATCLALRDVRVGYAAGAGELLTWERFCRRRRARQPLSCALAGYGGGVRAALSGRSSYPARVLARARAIHEQLEAHAARGGVAW
jgi:hypothetical protein